MTNRTDSAVESLKEIVIILTGLAIAYALDTTIKKLMGNNPGTESLSTLSLFILLALNIIRFYHGNMRLLDDSYEIAREEHNVIKRNFPFDFFVILITSISFAAMGGFVDKASYYFDCLLFILIVDVFWALIYITQHDLENLKVQRLWMINNLVYSIVIVALNLVASSTFASERLLMAVLTVVGVLSTLADFKFSWTFYFPRPQS